MSPTRRASSTWTSEFPFPLKHCNRKPNNDTSYLNSHIPKVKEIWGPHGLTDWKVVKYGPGPDGQPGPFQVSAILTFKDMGALGAAMQDPGSKYLQEDPKNYTDEASGKIVFLAGEEVASG